jgi:hypothetical protein
MKNIFETNFTRNLSAICLIAAPFLLLTGSISALISKDFNFASYIFGKAGAAMFVFAIFVLVQMLKPEMEKLAVIAGGMAITGAISGTTLVSFVYYGNELKNSGLDAAALQSIKTALGSFYMTMVFVPLPGLFLPIGLFVLSVGLFWKKIVPRPVAVVLAVAAISFPLGRIPQNATIFAITDSLFLISLGYVGWQVFSSTLTKQSQLSYSNT